MNKTNNDYLSLNPHRHLEWKAQRKNCKHLAKLVVNIKRVGYQLVSQEDLQVHVKRFGKVQQIKKKVKKLTGIPMIDQTLIFSGRQLDNTERIVSLLSSSSSSSANSSSLPETGLTLFLLVNKNSKAVNNESIRMSDNIPPSVDRQLEADVSAADGSSIQQQQELDSSPVPSKEGFIEEEKKAEEEPVVSPTTAAPVVQEPGFTAPTLSVVKLSYEEQHRRVPFEGASFTRLTSLCTSFFGVKNVNRMVIRYRDEDGDLVQLSSDAELAYALATHSSSSSSSTGSEAPVLKLVFSVKPVQPKAAVVNQPEENNNNNNNNLDKIASAPSEMRRLRDGDLIQLSNGGFNLVLSPSTSSAEEEEGVKKKKKNNFVIEGKKDDQSEASQWIVKKVVLAKGNDKKKGCHRENNGNEQEKEVIFLKNKTLSESNKQLRVVATGEVQHSGGLGKWARFIVDYLPNGGGIQLRSVGRSLLRDRDSSSSSFLGLQLDNNNQQQQQQQQQQQPQRGKVTRRIASGTFKKTDEHSKFAVRFVQ